MTTPRDTSAALTALLDALEVDLLGAPKEDVQTALRETGRAKRVAVSEIRSLLREAESDSADQYPLALRADGHNKMGAQRH